MLDFLRRRFLAATLVMAAAGAALPVPSALAAPEDAAAFVRTMADKTLREFTARKQTPEEVQQTFGKILDEGFAVRTIGLWVIADHQAQLQPAQRDRYLTLFRQRLVEDYAAAFASFSGQNIPFEVTSARSLSERDSIVQSRITPPNGGAAVPVEWRVRQYSDGLKAVDVAVSGASLSSTIRNNFNTVIEKRGIDGLLQWLEDRSKPALAPAGGTAPAPAAPGSNPRT
jgi:phospholipid transport system substrate-binding protein